MTGTVTAAGGPAPGGGRAATRRRVRRSRFLPSRPARFRGPGKELP
ncbi:MAG: hypothetical protein AVDCRST_MAG41-3246 [uncultured Corynebacteriales bacterium]|uniref:Uncharacterized protein n=1 Tax=uncultured Mycobacteriales bacterium TaxID=581187 RepID=A0A6J4JCI6_9ACTN|nr:MAG: hypothetical protein AVDCRST_MAG41-3246 [uncultured Corynebacteriales bacterium]